MTKNVLLTGSSGFIGRETCLALEAKGWTVYRGVRCARNENEITLDLDAPDFLCKLLSAKQIDTVVHLASRVGWDGASLAEQFMPNVAAVASLLAATKAWGSKFIFASAALVGAVDDAIDVGVQVIPKHPYLQSKWLAEELVKASGVPFLILRIGGVYGLRGPRHLGLNRAIEDASQGRRPQLVGKGLALRNYIYVKDIGRNIAYAMDHQVVGTHVIAGSDQLSIADMLDIVCDVFIPGQKPEQIEGWEVNDQIFKPSDAFPPSCQFRKGIENLLAEFRKS